MPKPVRPKIYHIVHVDRLVSIVADGCLWSTRSWCSGRAGTVIGMSGIKQRRLRPAVVLPPRPQRRRVCAVLFCPRSIMLYLIHCANHPELAYRGGQGPIIHLESDLHSGRPMGETNGRRWAFYALECGRLSTSQFRTRAGSAGRDQLGRRRGEPMVRSGGRSRRASRRNSCRASRFPGILSSESACIRKAWRNGRSAIAGRHRPTVEIRKGLVLLRGGGR